MSQAIAISVEGERARLVLGQRKGSIVQINELIEIDTSELTTYLRALKHKNVFIHFEDRDLIEEVLSLPPVQKDSIIKNLIGIELKKLTPENRQYLFWHVPYSHFQETSQFFVIATDRTVPEDLIHQFLEAGKKPAIVLPNYLPLLFIIPYSETPVLVFYQNGPQRTIILIKEQKPLLVRTVAGDPFYFTGTDVQHLNMTYNYCQQRLGLTPELIYIIGSLELSADVNMFPVIPIVTIYQHGFSLPKSITMDQFREFILPAAMLQKPPKAKGLTKAFMPPEYRVFRYVNSLISFTSMLYILLSIILILLSFYHIKSMSKIASKLQLLNRQTNLVSLYNEYNALKTQLDKARPVQTLLVKYKNRTAPWDIISKLTRALDPSVTLDSLDIFYSDKGIKIQLSGKITETTQSGFLKHLDLVSENLKKTFQTQNIHSTYSLRNKFFSFTINTRVL